MNEHRKQTESAVSFLDGEHEEEIRRLIAAAGPRPPIPAEEMAAIRSTARAEWRRLVEAERGRSRKSRRLVAAALAAGLLMALGVAYWWLGREHPEGMAVAATVELLRGDVMVERLAASLLPTTGDSLSAGDVLTTGPQADGSASRVALRLVAGPALRLDGHTRVRLLSGSSVELERGAVYVDSGTAESAAGAVRVETVFGTVTDVGTQFEVRLAQNEGAALRVRVREGSVSLELQTGKHAAAAGEELTLWPNGSIRRRPIQPHDPFWDWVLGAAPALEIEGLVLPVYLEWVARETGRRVRFTDPELADEAADIRLHGSIAGLTPVESLDVVLPGSGLAYRAENGVLAITRPPGLE